MTYYDHFTVTANIGAVLEDSELLSRCLDHTFLRKCKTWFLSIFTHQILQLVDWVRTPHIRYAYQTSMMNGYEHFFSDETIDYISKWGCLYQNSFGFCESLYAQSLVWLSDTWTSLIMEFHSRRIFFLTTMGTFARRIMDWQRSWRS